MKNKKIIALILTASMLSVSGCGDVANTESTEEEILAVEAVNPTTGSIEVTSEFVGILEYMDETIVFPKMSGEVTETFFEEGDYVEEGQLLFTIDDEALQMSLKSAQAQYKTAQAGTNQQVGALQMTRDNDLNTIATAGESMDLLRSTYDNADASFGDLLESQNDLKDDIDDYEKQIKKVDKAIKDAKAMGAPEESIAELKKTKSTLKSAIEQTESAIDQIEANKRSINLQKQNTVNSYKQAERGAAIAQENLEYFDTIQAPATIESAQATLELAQVGIESAKLQIGYTQITAPVSGIIQTKNVEVHGMAAAGNPACIITNDTGMNTTFNVTESTYKTLTLGQNVRIVRGDKEYTGKITEIPEELNLQTGMFSIKASVDGDTKDLHRGSNVEVYTITDHADNVMVIPIDCVYYEGGEAFVYLSVNNEVKKAYIETGLYDDNNIEVISGLSNEDCIITTWSSELRNGLKVNANISDDKEETE